MHPIILKHPVYPDVFFFSNLKGLIRQIKEKQFTQPILSADLPVHYRGQLQKRK